jgi:transketolase
LGRTNQNVVALCADLIGSLKMEKFIEENPNRFFQIGIAEANMIGIAAGLAIDGKIPLLVLLLTFLQEECTIRFVNL